MAHNENVLLPALNAASDFKLSVLTIRLMSQEMRKIRSLRLHAAQAYSRHIFEHKINV